MPVSVGTSFCLPDAKTSRTSRRQRVAVGERREADALHRRHHLLPRHRAQLGDRVRLLRLREADAVRLLVRHRPRAADAGAAVRDGALEESLRERRRGQAVHGARAGRLPGDRHAGRVAAERRDVVVHPSQRGNLIEQPVVARRVVARLLVEIRVREKPEHADPVIEGDDDQALRGQSLAVVGRDRSGAFDVPAAIDVDEHRTLRIRRAAGVQTFR